MKKILTKAVCLLTACMMLASCSNNGKEDKGEVIATVNGTAIYNADVVEFAEYYLSMYGIEVTEDMDESTQEFVDQIKEACLEQLITMHVQLEKAKEDGLDTLSDEETKEVNQQVDDMMSQWDDMMSQWDEYFTQEAEGEGFSGDELTAEVEKRKKDYMEETGYDEERIFNNYRDNMILEKLYDKYAATIEPTEEELKEQYDTQVAEEKERYKEDANLYGEDAEYSTVLYRPEGYRQVKHILIMPSNEDLLEVDELEADGKTEEAEALNAELMAQAKKDAEDLLKEIKADGSNFDELMKEHTGDLDAEGSPNMPEGYLLNAENTRYEENFTKAAMELENKGDLSQPVETDYGYHILMLVDILDEETTKFEDVPDDLIEEFTNTIRENAYLALIEEWKEKMTIETFPEKISLPVATPDATATTPVETAGATATPEATATPTPSASESSTPNPTATN